MPTHNHPSRIRISFDGRAIAYDVATPSLLKIRESQACNLLDVRHETTEVGPCDYACSGTTVS